MEPDATHVVIQTTQQRTFLPDSKGQIIALPGHAALPYQYGTDYNVKEWFDEQVDTVYPAACELREALINFKLKNPFELTPLRAISLTCYANIILALLVIVGHDLNF